MIEGHIVVYSSIRQHIFDLLSEDPRCAGRLIENDFDYLACRVAEHKALTRARRVKVLVAGLVAWSIVRP
jgi:hypothetical protein